MIAAIFEAIGQSITAFAANLASAFSSITTMFIAEGTGGAYSLTVLGTATLITAGRIC